MFLKHINTIRKRRLALTIAFSIFTVLSFGKNNVHQDIEMLENNKTYNIWETLHTFYDSGESDELIPDIELIESLPSTLKAIIAYYSTLIPEHFWNKDSRAAFVAALGNFSSLKEAQRKLLKGHSIKTGFGKGIPVSLDLKETDGAVFFTCTRHWQNYVTDEFRISKDGTITYVEKPEPIEPITIISYNSRRFMYQSYYNNIDNYTIKLNGKTIDFLNYYLDVENIKSVGVNERDKIVYIEQKNKNPKYFSLADIDLSGYPVKSINEVTIIVAEDWSSNGSQYYSDSIKIEFSGIKEISYIISEHSKTIGIVMK